MYTIVYVMNTILAINMIPIYIHNACITLFIIPISVLYILTISLFSPPYLLGACLPPRCSEEFHRQGGQV